MASHYQPILFDLDGTLIDSKPGILKGVQHTLTQLGFPQEWGNEQEISPRIGPPIVELFQFCLRQHACDGQLIQEAVRIFREYYKEQGLYECTPYAGIVELLSDLKEQGKTLAVATSKPTIFAKTILENLRLADYFSHIVGSHLDLTRTNKQEIIQAVLKDLAVKDHRDSIMVGDQYHDVAGALANDIASVWVSYGYGQRRDLQNYQPTFMVDSVLQLATIL